MASENSFIDENSRHTLLGVTDDSNAEIRRLLVDPATGRLKVSATISAGAISTINGDSTTTQTISIGTTGTDITIVDDSIGGHVINIPTSSGTNRGALSSTDWTTFNNKLATNGSGSNLTITSRTVGNSTNLDTALSNVDDALSAMSDNGFSAWTSGTDASTYSLVTNTFTLLRSGYGFITSKKISWTANQTLDLSSMVTGTTGFIYIDGSGTLQFTTSAATSYAAIMMFFVWKDGNNVYWFEKENHNYSFASKISSYLHNTINVVVRGTGVLIGRVAGGTGASADDRRILTTGADTIDDHGLSTAVPATNPCTMLTVYKNASAKWVQYHSQSEITPYWNNAGTPTALASTVTSYAVYTIYALQDDINSSSPRFMAVMDNAAYATLVLAQGAIAAGTVTFADNEIKTIEPCQLGYIIMGYSATGGYIYDLTVARNTFNQALVGGGGGAATDHAFLTDLDYASAGHTGFQPATAVASGAEVTTGTDNIKIVTAKAIADAGLVKDTDPTLAANSDTKIASQKAVKTYADTGLAGKISTANNSVTAAQLATSAITLGYSEITSNYATATLTVTQITGLTSTVTIPAGGRKIKVTAHCPNIIFSGAINTPGITIWDGTVGSGTQIASSSVTIPSAGYNTAITAIAILTPSAGSKTYNVGLTFSATGTTTILSSASTRAFILVEAI